MKFEIGEFTDFVNVTTDLTARFNRKNGVKTKKKEEYLYLVFFAKKADKSTNIQH